MKKFYNLLIALAAVMMIAACGKEENLYQAPEKTIEIVGTDVVFNPEGGTGSINITSTGAVSAVSNKDWCVASVAGNVVSVTVPHWTGIENRYALVTLKCGSYSVNVTVQQFGAVLGGVTGVEVVADAAGATQVVPVKANDTVSVSTDDDWITVSEEDGNVTIVVAKNTVQATRFGKVSVSVGESVHEIPVKQYPEFVEEPSWTPGYGGRYRYNTTTLVEVVTNTVADGSEAGLYYINYYSEADYKALKAPKGKSLCLAQGELLTEMVEYYKALGYDVSYETFLYEDSDYEFFSKVEPGKYYAVVTGFDADGNTTGRYATATFEVINVTNAPGWKAEYAGSYVYGSTVYDMVDFTAGEEDSYYAVVMDEASYEKYYYSDVTNLINDYVPYIIDTKPALHKGPKTLYFSKFGNGNWHTFMIGFDEEYNPTGKYFVGTFKIDEKPTEAYKAWLGDWQITTPRDGNLDVWTFEQGIINKSYLINNFGGHPASFGWTVTIDFNAEDGSISCANGQVVGADVTASGETRTPTLLAKAINPSTGGVSRISGTFTVFTGEIGTEGNATLTPGTVTISSWNPPVQPISGVQLYAVGKNGASYWRKETPLPNILKPYTGDSAPKKASAYLNVNAFTESYEPAAEMPYLMEAPVVEVAEAASKAVATKRLAVKADKQYRRK